jgi:hypothetical protein
MRRRPAAFPGRSTRRHLADAHWRKCIKRCSESEASCLAKAGQDRRKLSSDAWNQHLAVEKKALRVLEGTIPGNYCGVSKYCRGPTRILSRNAGHHRCAVDGVSLGPVGRQKELRNTFSLCVRLTRQRSQNKHSARLQVEGGRIRVPLDFHMPDLILRSESRD